MLTTLAAATLAASPDPTPSGTRIVLAGGDGQFYPVTAAVIDTLARNAYQLGQCHALALVLAEHTGWPLVWAGAADCWYDEDCAQYEDWDACPCQVQHLGVATPDGRFADILGVRTFTEVAGHYRRELGQTCQVFPMEQDMLDDVLTSSCWRTPDIATARSFLPAVLDLIAAAGVPGCTACPTAA